MAHGLRMKTTRNVWDWLSSLHWFSGTKRWSSGANNESLGQRGSTGDSQFSSTFRGGNSKKKAGDSRARWRKNAKMAARRLFRYTALFVAFLWTTALPAALPFAGLACYALLALAQNLLATTHHAFRMLCTWTCCFVGQIAWVYEHVTGRSMETDLGVDNDREAGGGRQASSLRHGRQGDRSFSSILRETAGTQNAEPSPSLASIRVREKLLNEYNVPEEVITELYRDSPAFFSRSSISAAAARGDVEEIIARVDNALGPGDDGYDSAVDEFMSSELDFDGLLGDLKREAGDCSSSSLKMMSDRAAGQFRASGYFDDDLFLQFPSFDETRTSR